MINLCNPLISVGGGGGIFLACKGLGRLFDHSYPACASFFFLQEINSHTVTALFRPGSVHSGSVS